jgi:uncharacterized protein
MKKESAPSSMDVKAFAHGAISLDGQDVLSSYGRLMQETQGLGGGGSLIWSALGELVTDQAKLQQVWLHLSVETCLPLTCQRCLGTVEVGVEFQRAFRFVESEDVAAAQDETSEEDVLALSRDFNLFELIEDEVLMSLPLVPRHEVCPVAVKLAVVDPDFESALEDKPKPFAALAKLRTSKPE